jgi:hypothetical protein
MAHVGHTLASLPPSTFIYLLALYLSILYSHIYQYITLTPPPNPLSCKLLCCRCTSRDFELARSQIKKFSEGQRGDITDAQLWRAHTMLAGIIYNL